jgi:hypothetical protein
MRRPGARKPRLMALLVDARNEIVRLRRELREAAAREASR